MPDEIADRFYDGVRSYYQTAYNYCVQWLPLDDPLYKHSRFIQFEKRAESNFDDFCKLLEIFPKRFSTYINDPVKLNALEEEFLLYQSMVSAEISDDIWEESKVRVTDEKSYHRMDIIWGSQRDTLPNLSSIALFLLTIPHSNAAEERIFSMIGKNNTKFRSSLELSRSLNSIMLIKMNQPESLVPCYRSKFSEELLLKCKSACSEYNKEHSSKS